LNVGIVHGISVITPPTVDELPGQAEVMEQAGRENFTVASAMLGRERQRQLRAIYGFARLVDDVGDEASGDRIALLDLVEEELDRVYGVGAPRHPVMVELAAAVRAGSLPPGPFRRLIEANRLDQRTSHYDTFEQLLGYCQLSAAPVGELVLHVFGAATRARIALSDRICAGLQITEHLQDVAEDFRRGRVYVPRDDLIRFGCDNEDLSAPPTARCQALIAFEARRAHQLLSSGAPLARTLSLRPRIAVAGFVAGGRAALAVLPAVHSPGDRTPRRRAFAAAFMRAVMGR
jgi:squalene synthase HpnC